jgi:hypothetical protein
MLELFTNFRKTIDRMERYSYLLILIMVILGSILYYLHNWKTEGINTFGYVEISAIFHLFLLSLSFNFFCALIVDWAFCSILNEQMSFKAIFCITYIFTSPLLFTLLYLIDKYLPD